MVRRLSPLPSPFLRFKKATFLQRKSCSGYENPGCWKAGALSTRLASAGSLPRCPQGPCPPCVAIVQAQLRAPARPAAACRRRERRRARSAPAEPWARRAFLRLSPGWSPRCVCRASSVSVTRGPGALTHLADSILFPHPPPASLPSLPAGSPPLYSACSLATSSMPCFHKYEVPKPGAQGGTPRCIRPGGRHPFDPP